MIPAATAEFYRSQQRLAVLTVAASRRAWAGMGDDFDRSWSQAAPKLVVLAAAAQLSAARAGAAYVPRVLEETGQDDDPAAEVSPRAFVGTAADGRPLDGLLVGAVVEAKMTSGQGLSSGLALQQGGRWLDMAMQTLVADAGRQASGVGIAARPSVGGYVRMLNTPSCGRCAVLAGKFFKWNAGFQRHPFVTAGMCRHPRTSPGTFAPTPTRPPVRATSRTSPRLRSRRLVRARTWLNS